LSQEELEVSSLLVVEGLSWKLKKLASANFGSPFSVDLLLKDGKSGFVIVPVLEVLLVVVLEQP